MKLASKLFLIAALIMACFSMWEYGKAHADQIVTITVLDDSNYPEVKARFVCESPNPQVMIAACAVALREYCPDDGMLGDAQESAPGVIPARIEFISVCRRDQQI